MAAGDDPPMSRGLDLAYYRELVENIYFRRFAWRVRVAGLDEEDVLQVVFQSILRRNQGRSPYQREKSSPANWIWMVVRSVVVNEIDKQRRRESWETLGEGEDVALYEPFRPVIQDVE